MSGDEWTQGVAAAYDRAAHAYHQARRDLSPSLRRYLEALVRPLPAGAAVLDVGCGTGQPVAKYLVERGFEVTGLDISPRLLALARQQLPGTRFIHGDMRKAEIHSLFHAIVAWDSVFHVPREEHAALFGRFKTWLRPFGRLLVSLGGSAWEGASEMLGETFYYSGFAPEESLDLLRLAGFEILIREIDDPTSRGHLVILASGR